MSTAVEQIAEHWQCVRGAARYFVLRATRHGVIQVVISRKEKGSRDGPDAACSAFLFTRVPEARESWTYIAALNYTEMASHDIPMHGDLEPHLNKLRADTEDVIERALAILDADAEVGS